jgi:hypothetical protein
MKSLRVVALIIPFLFVAQAWSAVPRSLKESAGDTGLVREALKLPFDNRVQALKAQGGKAAHTLAAMVFDSKLDLETRWRALTVLPSVDKALGREQIEKALQSREWYLRNAATVALPSLDRLYAIEKSAELMSDQALVVRTAASQNLLKLGAREKESLLWEKLNDAQNFRKGQSLWIRRHIARALSELASAGSEPRFITMLADSDVRLHPFAMRGLERLTGKAFARGTPEQTRGRWLAWAREHAN